MQKQVEAYNRRDLNAIMNCFAVDIKFFRLPDNQITVGQYVSDWESISGFSKYPNGISVISINEVREGLIQNIWLTPF